MGKQINYWIEYESFLQIAQTALDCGCILIKNDISNDCLLQSKDISFITPDCCQYHFYFPETGPFEYERINAAYAKFTHETTNAIIEASYSFVCHAEKKITRSRLYAISGYYDKNGTWIAYPDSITKVYHRLVRIAKKLAPYTDIIDTLDQNTEHERQWEHKEYISPYCLHLKNDEGYRIYL